MSTSGPTPEELQKQWNNLRKQSEEYNNQLNRILSILQNMLKGPEDNYFALDLTHSDQVFVILQNAKPPSEAEQRIVQEHFRDLTSSINTVVTTIVNKQVEIQFTPDEIDLLSQANERAKQLSALRKSSPDYKSRSAKIADLGHFINQRVSGALTSIGAAFASLAKNVKDSVKSYAMTHGSSSSSYGAGEWGEKEGWYQPASPIAKQDNDSIFTGFGKLLAKAGSFFSSVRHSPNGADLDAPKSYSNATESELFPEGHELYPVDDEPEAQAKAIEPEEQPGHAPQVNTEVEATPQDEMQNFSLPTSEFKAELKALAELVNKNLNHSQIDSESKQLLENFAENLNFSRFQLEKGNKSPAEIAQGVKWDLQNIKELQEGLNVSPELKQKIDDVQRAVDKGLNTKRVTFAPDTKG